MIDNTIFYLLFSIIYYLISVALLVKDIQLVTILFFEIL